MGEVTPGPLLLQAGLLSSTPGEAARSLLGALTGVEGAMGAGTPALLEEEEEEEEEEVVGLPVELELALSCSTLLEFFASAGTGIVARW